MSTLVDKLMAVAAESQKQLDEFDKLPMSRTDENGRPCPATLGEYLDVCNACEPGSKASQYLEGKILESPNGRDEKVEAPDSQMRALLMPMILEDSVSDQGVRDAIMAGQF